MGFDAISTSNLTSEDVALGHDGFLFHLFGNVINRLCTEDLANNHELTRWKLGIENDLAWCAEEQVRYTTMIIPERHVIYADKLPSPYAISATRSLVRLLNSVDPAMRSALLYPERELLAARREGDVFYRTDEHLNSHGHYACYLALLDHIRAAYPVVPAPRSSMGAQRVHVSGNLGMLLEDEPTEDREYWLQASDRGVRRPFQSRRGRSRVEIFESPDRTLPRALIFGDSHLDELRHILAPHFSRLVVVHQCHRFLYDLVRREQPDFVFRIMAELNLARVYEGGSIESSNADFLAQCGEPLPGSPILLSIDFGRHGESRAFITEGWSYVEETHCWMVGTESILRLPLGTGCTLPSSVQPHTMTISLWPLTWPAQSRNRQSLSISYGKPNAWKPLAKFDITGAVDLDVPLEKLQISGENTHYLRFEHPDGFSPRVYGEHDERILSFAVKRISISANHGVVQTPAPTQAPARAFMSRLRQYIGMQPSPRRKQ
jgi:hypothetical protein